MASLTEVLYVISDKFATSINTTLSVTLEQTIAVSSSSVKSHPPMSSKLAWLTQSSTDMLSTPNDKSIDVKYVPVQLVTTAPLLSDFILMKIGVLRYVVSTSIHAVLITMFSGSVISIGVIECEP